MSQGQQVSGTKEYIDERWFKEFDGKVTLMGVKCGTCKKVFFPKKEVCPVCFDGELREEPLSMRGKLHTFSRTEIGVTGLEVPYVYGFIDLPEGIKLFGLITDCEPWDKVLRVGMEMEIFVTTVRKDPSDKEIVAYKFRPLGGKQA
jgi:uncharacterized OB-fold protein